MSTEKTYTESWLEGPLHTAFYTRIYRPQPPIATRAALVFAHGYLEHVDRYAYPEAHARWASRGIAVLTFDQRGFGRTALDLERRSSGSAYGRAGEAEERMADLEWAVKVAKTSFGRDVPVFLMGHSMVRTTFGTCFATRATAPPEKATVKLLAGVISSSPLIRIGRKDPSTALKFIVRVVIYRLLPLKSLLVADDYAQDLSRDPAMGESALKDPWIKSVGTGQSILDMIDRGEYLLREGFKHWPADLPVLILHGTADVVNAFAPTKEFAELLQAPDKEFVEYDGAWHDLLTDPEVKDKYFEDIVNWIERHLSL
ncbi:lysophospholipase [Irpex lacteus]|nr:lysophospholipase [Irpex lacteus]